MILNLFASTKVCEVEATFSTAFPFLRLKICKPAINPSETERDSARTNGCIRLINISSVMHRGSFTVSDEMTVSEFRQIMEARFGLQVKLLRKAAMSWVEIRNTSAFTLVKENSLGRKEFELAYCDAQIL